MDGKQHNQQDVLEASLLPQFEDHLRTFLYQEKGRVLLISCVTGALKAITDSTLALKVERHASSMSLKELEEKIGRFNLELQGLEKEREMSLLLLDGRMKGVFEEFNVDLEAFKKETLARLHQEVQDAFQQKVRACGRLAPGNGGLSVRRPAQRLYPVAARRNRSNSSETGRYTSGIC